MDVRTAFNRLKEAEEVVITFLFLYFLKKLLIFENSLFTLFILNIMILFEKTHAPSLNHKSQ
jgi:hypothetical protein